jgi:D-inositol-3-phosphate glycosyltransferase
VALEAAACGTPVVAAVVGGLRTLVDHGRTGFLVDGRDPEEYAKYIDEILGNTALAVEQAAAAVDRAAAYTWSSTAEHLRRLYDDLTAVAPVSCH